MVTRPPRSAVQRELLRSAEHVFSRDGYQQASLQAIADRAGFTKGAVYSNFTSKPELFATVCETWTEDWIERLRPRLVEAIEAARDLEAVAEGLASVLVAEIPRATTHQRTLSEFRLLAVRAQELRATYAGLAGRRIAVLEETLLEHPLTAKFTAERRRGIAFGALTMLNALAVERLAAPTVASDELVREALARCLKGLLA
ncbi:TetR/AcrR family transcriptional regulator [uncultured Tessaracoccus sp.]|uniref:TetR/AcrR family transcriptional regulator n=1 Tax=uncultured Tessaracoccus sp. TaxID=905023 RepID=UPI0025D639D0|nr:TetR family transcriptional regulator [uncultured Tessaracoccus sp.]